MEDKYLAFKQDGVEYNLYEMPKGFVIRGDLNLSCHELTELPDLSEVIVEGDFYCYGNHLTTLEGAPKEVGENFYCGDNKLTTLRGAPQVVGGSFQCLQNQLTSLKGAPQTVGGYFYCDNNRLTSLEGAPQRVKGSFSCCENQLTTLKGAPKESGGGFFCTDNQLTSLFGIPQNRKDCEIRCDDDLGKKYGFSSSALKGFTFEALSESALYKSEVAADNIRRKQAQERSENATAKTKAAFEAWLKNKGIEPPER